jgi:hypothetical protein
MTDYWATTDQLDRSLYNNMMKQDSHLHILQFLHFTDNRSEVDRINKTFYRLQKIKRPM